ncbi:hypothetical protein QAD02_022103 [Eretmocerus hayati]|uniref:Uncharacterized protein n=1 Tax=Eretmocerus hayati TaxID=131215 RepID=A0ACC2PSM0_9HYME|nr:hypothetical protein QAD02_022103 [Eretmocerus hayati]
MTEDPDIMPVDASSEALPDSPRKPVKSTAVVKYSAAPAPATFAQLQCNTDLNLPPSNWLSTSAESYGLQNVWSHNTGFSSFRMAHMFPDCIGEVDVVSDAENIKKLLKLPYSDQNISMMVHRVGNSLLLDDFDIHKYLLRQAENDWEWLKEFFYEHVFKSLGDKEKRLFPKANSRNAIQQKNLISKFLYHSLVLADDKTHSVEKPSLPVQPLQPLLPEPSEEDELPDPDHSHSYTRNVVWTFENIHMLIGTDMPIFGGQTHPCISLKLRDATKPINVLTGIDYWLDNLMCNVPEVIMCYHLDGIVQKYELIKTEDLPNLEGSKFSQKVIRDIAQNILSFLKSNVTKAGHTYWLFKGKNDDVVKLYDLTSLCSDLSEDKGQNPFTIPVAMLLYRVARNMKFSLDYRQNQGTIRMLLQNCIQLLPKEKYPQIVTSAHFMLADLYIPADTDPLKPTEDDGDGSDLHGECTGNTDSKQSDGKLEEEPSDAIKSFTLSNFREHHRKDDFEEYRCKYPPITGTVEARCQSALDHIIKGLECLKYFDADSEGNDENSGENDSKEEQKMSKHEYDEATKNMAKPFQAIPMPYAPLTPTIADNNTQTSSRIETSPSSNKKGKHRRKKTEKSVQKTSESSSAIVESPSVTSLLCKANSNLPTWEVPKRDDNRRWNAHLKTLLYEKASLVFSVLAEYEYANKKFGSSLRYIFAVLRCQKMLELYCSARSDSRITYQLLGRAGDCYFRIVQDWHNVNEHKEEFEKKTDPEMIITDAISDHQLIENDAEVLPERFDTIEGTMVASFKCYERAKNLAPTKQDENTLYRRLGNIHNELGVLYMNEASLRNNRGEDLMDKEHLKDEKNPIKRSLMHLETGIHMFEQVRDEANLALLHCNSGRLMRLCAHCKKESSERHFYNKAVEHYQRALQILGTRKSHPEVWDNVTWELSSTLFNMAILMQDFTPVGSKCGEDLERQVVEILQKALKYCDTDTPGSRQPVYQYRAAEIQRRLASLHHRVYLESDPDSESAKRKNSWQLAKLYYEKATKILFALEQTTEFLRAQMERLALFEYQAENVNAFNVKLKAYQTCLELISQTRPIIDVIVDRNKSVVVNKDHPNREGVGEQDGSKDKEKEERNAEKEQLENEENVVRLLEERLQFILRSLIKLCLSKSAGNQKKECDSYAELYKKCYRLTLRSESLSGIDLIKHVADVLSEIENILQSQIKRS